MLSSYGTFPVPRFEGIPAFCPFFQMTLKIPDPEFGGISVYFTSCLSSFNDSIIYAFNSCTLNLFCHSLALGAFMMSLNFSWYCSSIFLIFRPETFTSPTKHFCMIMFSIVSKHLDLSPWLLETSHCPKRLSLPWDCIKIHFVWRINNYIKIPFLYSYSAPLLLSLGY